ncbi:MAG: hypothetical protein ACO24H_02355 [Polynucleobacter sp.]
MPDQPPEGYEELGETLAQPIVEGFKSLTWGAELAKLLGYRRKDLLAWIEHYKSIHAAELTTLERQQKRRERKINRWKRKIKQLSKKRLDSQ